MKIIKTILVSLLAIIILGVALLYVSGHGYIVTGVQRTYMVGNVTAHINDHDVFETRVIKTSDKQALPKHVDYNKKALPAAAIDQLKKYDSAAYLVLQNGEVLHESYFSDYHNRSKTNSFSMAKTVTTMLLGIAIAEGHVTGLDQPITDFLPEFKNDPLGSKATIGQLSSMTSGYDWDEHYYSPFSPTVELLHGDNIREFLVERQFTSEPGTYWYYSSASTQLMGIFLERALQQAGAAQNISEYLSEKIWQPLKMNDDALWHLDDNGMELVFCCLNTNARNYAKLGLLMSNNGQWNNQQIIPADFVQQMITPGLERGYGLSTWLGMHESPAYFWFSGHLGQYIISIPEHNMVVVRLGERSEPAGESVKKLIDIALELAK